MVKRTYANNHKTKYPQQCIQLRFYHDRFKVLAMSKATKQQKSYYLDDLAKAQGLIRWVRPIEKCRWMDKKLHARLNLVFSSKPRQALLKL